MSRLSCCFWRPLYVRDCGIGQEGAIGIWVGLARGTIVAHNLVHGLPYGGISVGWQWNPKPTACKANVVEHNHVYDALNRLCDSGAIYTLGFQPGLIPCNGGASSATDGVELNYL